MARRRITRGRDPNSGGSERGLIGLIKRVVASMTERGSRARDDDFENRARQGGRRAAAGDGEIPDMAPKADSGFVSNFVNRWNAKVAGGSAKKGKKGKPKFSRLARSWAARILKMGPNVPGYVRQVAADVLNENSEMSEGEVLETFREYQGTQRTGASEFKKVFAPYRRAMRKIGNIGAMINAVSAGGPGSDMAAMGLVETTTEIAEDFFNSKQFKTAMSKITDKLFKNPGMGLRAASMLGRATVVAGIAADMALKTGKLRLWTFDEWAQYQAKQGYNFDTARNNLMAPQVANRVLGGAQNRAMRQRTMLERAWDANTLAATHLFEGEAGLSSSTMNEIERRKKTVTDTLLKARENAGGLGLNVSAILQKKARAVGGSVENLTEREKAEAIDEALLRVLDPENYVNDPRVITELNKMTGLEKVLYFASSEARRAEKHKQMAEEKVIPRIVNDKIERRKANEIAAEKIRQQLWKSPEERTARERQIRDQVKAQEADRSRHAQVWKD